MLTDTAKWSHARGNEVVPSPWPVTDPTERQQVKLAWIANNDPKLHPAHQLKEGLRVVSQLSHDEAGDATDKWVGWARCRLRRS